MGVMGLVHDLDYERYPDEHCIKVKEILTENWRKIISGQYKVMDGKFAVMWAG